MNGGCCGGCRLLEVAMKGRSVEAVLPNMGWLEEMAGSESEGESRPARCGGSGSIWGTPGRIQRVPVHGDVVHAHMRAQTAPHPTVQGLCAHHEAEEAQLLDSRAGLRSISCKPSEAETRRARAIKSDQDAASMRERAANSGAVAGAWQGQPRPVAAAAAAAVGKKGGGDMRPHGSSVHVQVRVAHLAHLETATWTARPPTWPRQHA